MTCCCIATLGPWTVKPDGTGSDGLCGSVEPLSVIAVRVTVKVSPASTCRLEIWVFSVAVA
ncbi:MAG: hypothetical protein DYH12_09205 [Sorangiineae bacterium PRO1]|nr:hypothetical protein [Sorangiineae bacterium PRO1]